MSMHSDDRMRKCAAELEFYRRKVRELERYLTQHEVHAKRTEGHSDLLASKSAQPLKRLDKETA